MMFSCAIQVAPAMFEEEEQEQEVSPLKAALEEAVSAAEAQGRSKQPGEATALLAFTSLFCTVCPAVIANVLLLYQLQLVFHIMLVRAMNRVAVVAISHLLCCKICVQQDVRHGCITC